MYTKLKSYEKTNKQYIYIFMCVKFKPNIFPTTLKMNKYKWVYLQKKKVSPSPMLKKGKFECLTQRDYKRRDERIIVY